LFPEGSTLLRLGAAVKDMKVHLEKLRTGAEECALISKLATDKEKEALFARLAAHLKALASEVERAIASNDD
jgi:hypothetical protein